MPKKKKEKKTTEAIKETAIIKFKDIVVKVIAEGKDVKMEVL